MKVLLILALIAAALGLTSLIRVGVRVVYVPSGLSLWVTAGPLRVRILPRMEKKRGGKKREKERTSDQTRHRTRDMLGQLRRWLPVIVEAGGKLKRKVRIERFYLDVTVAVPDPASAALAFGGVNAVLGMIWPLVEQNFTVKDRRIRTRVDFEANRPTADLDVTATLTVGQALALTVDLAPKLARLMDDTDRAGNKTKQQTDTLQKEAV